MSKSGIKPFSVLLFEDQLYDSESQSFPDDLRAGIRSSGGEPYVTAVLSIQKLIELLQEEHFDVLILDIMAECPEFYWDEQEREPVLATEAGVAVLTKLRTGAMGDLNSKIRVIVRSARGETYIRKAMYRAGIEGFFAPGSDDEKIIRVICAMVAGNDVSGLG